ncbi:hypothetical protein [Parasitella parasitica]|uniref:Uncharacterized protein n=1 Tax=Parasitella parasitica TaxID=35722 RepID=A0A0B7MWG8_9FUNG|nr:hypothetical protein [Parasitella parasitica]
MPETLPPPPPPKKVNMPPMTDADIKKLGVSTGSPLPAGGGSLIAAPMMTNPICAPMMGSGYPGIGGMGPNLVFNFSSPCGYVMAAVSPACGSGSGAGGAKVGGKKDEGGGGSQAKPKPEYVQADPTWRNPRLVQEKGKPLNKEPCIIQ